MNRTSSRFWAFRRRFEGEILDTLSVKVDFATVVIGKPLEKFGNATLGPMPLVDEGRNDCYTHSEPLVDTRSVYPREPSHFCAPMVHHASHQTKSPEFSEARRLASLIGLQELLVGDRDGTSNVYGYGWSVEDSCYVPQEVCRTFTTTTGCS